MDDIIFRALMLVVTFVFLALAIKELRKLERQNIEIQLMRRPLPLPIDLHPDEW